MPIIQRSLTAHDAAPRCQRQASSLAVCPRMGPPKAVDCLAIPRHTLDAPIAQDVSVCGYMICPYIRPHARTSMRTYIRCADYIYVHVRARTRLSCPAPRHVLLRPVSEVKMPPPQSPSGWVPPPGAGAVGAAVGQPPVKPAPRAVPIGEPRGPGFAGSRVLLEKFSVRVFRRP